MDNLSGLRLKLAFFAFLQWAVVGTAIGGLAFVAPVIDSRINPVRAHAVAFAVSAVLLSGGILRAIYVWLRAKQFSSSRSR